MFLTSENEMNTYFMVTQSLVIEENVDQTSKLNDELRPWAS